MHKFEPNQVIIREDLDYPQGALVVHGYAEDGSLMAFPEGGGFQYLIPSEEIPRFHLVPEEEKNVKIFRKTLFCLEGLDDETFEGFTDGSSWNGWEMPAFTFKSAQSVLNALCAVWTFDEDKKVLRANLDAGNGPEDHEWEAEILPLPDGGFVEAYPIGAGQLIWEETGQSC
jgi:hypothetical protein